MAYQFRTLWLDCKMVPISRLIRVSQRFAWAGLREQHCAVLIFSGKTLNFRQRASLRSMARWMLRSARERDFTEPPIEGS